MLKIYHDSFNKKVSYKIILSDETDIRSHEISFLNKSGTLYGLLKNLVTSKMNATNANADQTGFIVYLLMGYYDKDFFIEKTRVFKKSDSWQNKALAMANIISKNSKKTH